VGDTTNGVNVIAPGATVVSFADVRTTSAGPSLISLVVATVTRTSRALTLSRLTTVRSPTVALVVRWSPCP
jgi:hypothetical protein